MIACLPYDINVRPKESATPFHCCQERQITSCVREDEIAGFPFYLTYQTTEAFFIRQRTMFQVSMNNCSTANEPLFIFALTSMLFSTSIQSIIYQPYIIANTISEYLIHHDVNQPWQSILIKVSLVYPNIVLWEFWWTLRF